MGNNKLKCRIKMDESPFRYLTYLTEDGFRASSPGLSVLGRVTRTEDITMLDMYMPHPSPYYKSSPTQLPRLVRIQSPSLHSFEDISLVLHVLERGRRHRHFGFVPSSSRFVDHSV
jgi:hypothetical protein